jgi:hypothetical protein
MNKNLKIALIGVGVLGVGYGLYLYFRNKGTSSNDPQKDQRRITIKRS